MNSGMKSPHLKEQFALCPNSGSNKKDQINSATVCPVYSALNVKIGTKSLVVVYLKIFETFISILVYTLYLSKKRELYNIDVFNKCSCSHGLQTF